MSYEKIDRVMDDTLKVGDIYCRTVLPDIIMLVTDVSEKHFVSLNLANDRTALVHRYPTAFVTRLRETE